MRIALVAPPFLAVPPKGYGGIEQVIAALAEGLGQRGHEVILFASSDSETGGELRSPLAAAPGPEHIGDEFLALSHVLDVYLGEREFDIVHDHTLQGTALAVALDRHRVVHTLHGPWTEPSRRYYSRVHRRVHLVAISETQKSLNPAVDYEAVIPNGTALDTHPFRSDKEDFVVFVGRSNPEKGPEQAVEVARRAGMRLVMVVKRAESTERAYWDERVAPFLTGEEEVLEELPHEQVADIVSRARAMVFPIQWEEPFGLVMTEAMACGTPVVTRPLGAARELVIDGETGYLRDTVEEMAEALAHLDRLSPQRCRDHVAEHYSAETMVDRYERLFERLCS
ncbi:MAG TPA: glycosyltransferase family 4 protein [Acidimicrobiales bacterium]|nr:glycosyltransferase family 4 protein [Acidimicrobiales bacterium]